MVIERPDRLRKLSRAVTFGGLLVIAAGLAAMLAMTSAEAVASSGARQEYFYRMAWIAAALLAVALLLIAWTILRHVRQRTLDGCRRRRTQLVDAWAEAGRRYKLDEDTMVEDDEEEPDDGDDDVND